MLNRIKHLVSSFAARVEIMREEGQALVEYSLILSLVSIVAIAALEAVGAGVIAKLGEVTAAL
jgi:Flp pilus assembly pilin Flp